MAFCKFCGKKLGKDGKCSCAEFQNNEKNAEALIGKVEKKADKPIKRGGTSKYIVIAVILLLLFGIGIWIGINVNSYKKPVSILTKGISKNDTEMLIESMYTEATAAEIRVKAQENDLSWKDYIKQNNKAVESAMDGLGIKKVKSKIVAKEKLSGSNFDNVKRYYDQKYNIDVKKAYRVEVKFNVKINGVMEEMTGWLCVVKLKGEGWKYCPKYSVDSFDFIDAATNFE